NGDKRGTGLRAGQRFNGSQVFGLICESQTGTETCPTLPVTSSSSPNFPREFVTFLRVVFRAHYFVVYLCYVNTADNLALAAAHLCGLDPLLRAVSEYHAWRRVAG